MSQGEEPSAWKCFLQQRQTCHACHQKQTGDYVNHSVRGRLRGSRPFRLSSKLWSLFSFHIQTEMWFPWLSFLENTWDEFYEEKEKLLTGKASEGEGVSSSVLKGDSCFKQAEAGMPGTRGPVHKRVIFNYGVSWVSSVSSVRAVPRTAHRLLGQPDVNLSESCITYCLILGKLLNLSENQFLKLLWEINTKYSYEACNTVSGTGHLSYDQPSELSYLCFQFTHNYLSVHLPH